MDKSLTTKQDNITMHTYRVEPILAGLINSNKAVHKVTFSWEREYSLYGFGTGSVSNEKALYQLKVNFTLMSTFI